MQLTKILMDFFQWQRTLRDVIGSAASYPNTQGSEFSMPLAYHITSTSLCAIEVLSHVEL